LRQLSADDPAIRTLSPGDAAKSQPPPMLPRHPRAGDALVTSLKEKPDLFEVASAAAVLPKGRNFH